jgi:hypothetical protein
LCMIPLNAGYQQIRSKIEVTATPPEQALLLQVSRNRTLRDLSA